MDFWGDERGQPVQIGFILLFGILVLAFASYQGYVVPNQNAQVEFNHFETVSDQFAEFDTNAVNTIGNDVERSSSFALGVQYPSRLIALNPPPVSGRLETTAPRRVSVVNGTGDDKTADICGSDKASSRSLVYTPNYNEYGEAQSMTYENTFVTRSFRERNLHGDQRLVRTVDGNDRIDLLLLNRSVSVDRQGTYSLKMEGTHRYSKTVENVTVTIATQFSNRSWEEEILGDRDDVSANDSGPGQVNLTFDGGDYEVSCAVVGLNGEPAFEPPESGQKDSSTFDTRWVEANGQSVDAESVVAIKPSETVSTTVEVLGRESRNPIEQLTLTMDHLQVGGDTEAFDRFDFPGSQDTGSDGRVTVNVTAADSSSATAGDKFETYVTAGDDSDVLLFEIQERTMAERVRYKTGSGTTFDTKNSGVRFTMENTGGTTATITEIAVKSTETEATHVENPEGYTFRTDGGTQLYETRLDIGSSPSQLERNLDISGNGEVTLELTQFKNENAQGNDQVGMGSSQVTVRFVFGDGSEGEYQIST